METKNLTKKNNTEQKLLFELEELYGIKYWPNTDTFPFRDYHDFTHFNIHGRDRYSNWFIENLSEYLKN